MARKPPALFTQLSPLRRTILALIVLNDRFLERARLQAQLESLDWMALGVVHSTPGRGYLSDTLDALLRERWIGSNRYGIYIDDKPTERRALDWARTAKLLESLERVRSLPDPEPSRKIETSLVDSLRRTYRHRRWDEYLTLEKSAREEEVPEGELEEILRGFLSEESPDVGFLESMPDALLRRALHFLVIARAANLEKTPGILELAMRHGALARKGEKRGLFLFDLEALRLSGRLGEALAVMADVPSLPVEWEPLRGRLLLFTGNVREAIAAYEKFLPRHPAGEGGARFALDAALYYPLALMVTGDPADLEHAITLCDVLRSGPVRMRDYACLHALGVFFRDHHLDPHLPSALEWSGPRQDLSSVHVYFLARIKTLEDPGHLSPNLIQLLKGLGESAREGGCLFLAAEFEEMLARVQRDPAVSRVAASRAAGIRQRTGLVSLLGLLPEIPLWRRRLDRLIALGPPPAPPEDEPDERLAWRLVTTRDYTTLAPVLQKRSKHGSWSKGRETTPDRLLFDPGMAARLGDQDRRVLAQLEAERNHLPHDPDDRARRLSTALLALAGHPRVFHEGVTHPVEVMPGEARVRVRRSDRSLFLHLEPAPISPMNAICLDLRTPGKLKVCLLTDEQVKIAKLLRDGLEVPLEEEASVLAAMRVIAPRIALDADIADDMDDLVEHPASRTLRARLTPAGEGLAVSFRVQPLGDEGPSFPPGQGGRVVIGMVSGRRARAVRDLDHEREHLKSVLEHLDGGIDGPVEAGMTELVRPDPEDALELLASLKEAPGPLSLEWPEGERWQLRAEAGPRQLSLVVRETHDYFTVDGDLKVDETEVLNLSTLLQLVRKAHGRFVPLGEGRYLALTRELMNRLEDLHAFSRPGSDEVRLHPWMAPILEETWADLRALDTDAAWRRRLAMLREAAEVEITVPPSLLADLRPYQVEGFRWMARLADCEAGACLADDMGLGKTIQALALLLRRATMGPALVVGPTSVMGNWLDEIRRFAPALNPRLVSTASGAGFEGTKDHHVVLVSYTVLAGAMESFAAQEWSTVILDEAQAIKNSETQRAKAVLALRSRCRVALTGTPLENHLGEIWSLFRYLVPGLLGSLETFRQRYVLPIERDQDPAARDRLRRLLSPFILRRTKSQVLVDLPSRTEIVRRVELGPAERAFYEAVRRDALEALASTGSGPEERIRILAEITRLRRACCDPRLVLPSSTIPSSKREEFARLVEELIEEGHRCLVFSQFVGHLALLESWLREAGIAYEYLDGSTPVKKRRQAIEAFQSGSAPLFLISLKAGGVGLNLTAADYVIHMDPWWNPAVEDQASDRAHRIGQTRPVTIYRIVAQDTLEEKILELHKRKRDLAMQVLEDGGGGPSLTVEELLDLLREDRTPAP